MPVTYLNTSTLSEALDDTLDIFTVGSTTNVTAGQYLAILGTAGLEMVKVLSIPTSGQVKVTRGVNGTHAVAHVSGTKFFIGDPDDFKTIPDSTPSRFISLSGTQGNFPQWAIPGTRAVDGAGNEYVMVDLTETVVPGATVLISKDGNFTASVLTSAGIGDVGIVVEDATSDQWTWALIKGFYAHAKLVGGSSLNTSVGEFGGATSVSTPSVGLFGRLAISSGYREDAVIYGMFAQSAVSTASTSASSETGYFQAVWLNYPYHLPAVSSA